MAPSAKMVTPPVMRRVDGTLQQLERELSVAAQVQESLMPRCLPRLPGFEMTAYYRPCQYVGGDYYDFIPVGDKKLVSVVADVSGKGMPAALVMVEVRALIRALTQRGMPPTEVVVELDRYLCGDIPRGMFVTAFCTEIELDTGKCRGLSCGHNPMILWRARTRACEIVNPSGIALGFNHKLFGTTLREATFQFELGDRMVMYTDGLIEVANAQQEPFGLDRLSYGVKKNAHQESGRFLGLLLKTLSDHQATQTLKDDITVVTIRRVQAEAKRAAAVPRPDPNHVLCGLCGEINASTEERCTLCREPLKRIAPVALLQPRPDECASCGKRPCACRRVNGTH